MTALWIILHSSSWKWVTLGVMLALYLNSCTFSAGTEGENPLPPSAYGFIYLIFIFLDEQVWFCQHFTSCCPALFDLLIVFLLIVWQKWTVIWSNTDDLQFSALPIKVVQWFLFSLSHSTPKSLLLANKPLGGNISPAVPFPLVDWFQWQIPVLYSVTMLCDQCFL